MTSRKHATKNPASDIEQPTFNLLLLLSEESGLSTNMPHVSTSVPDATAISKPVFPQTIFFFETQNNFLELDSVLFHINWSCNST